MRDNEWRRIKTNRTKKKRNKDKDKQSKEKEKETEDEMREKPSRRLLPGSLSCAHICLQRARTDPHVFAQVAWLPFLPLLSPTKDPLSFLSLQERSSPTDTGSESGSHWTALMTHYLTRMISGKQTVSLWGFFALTRVWIEVCVCLFFSPNVCMSMWIFCICMIVCDSGAVCWSLLSGYNGPAWGPSSTKRPSLNNVPSQREEEPDQSITTLKGSQSFPWYIWYQLWFK